MGSSGLKALLFIIPRLPGCSLMTFSSKSPNSWPAVKVRNPWIISIHLPAWSILASAVSHIPPKTMLQTPKICSHTAFHQHLQNTGAGMETWNQTEHPHCQTHLHSLFLHQWDTRHSSAVLVSHPRAQLQPAKDPRAQTAEIRTLRHGAECRKQHRQPKSPRWKLRTNGTSINNVHLSSTQNSLLEANSEQALGSGIGLHKWLWWLPLLCSCLPGAWRGYLTNQPTKKQKKIPPNKAKTEQEKGFFQSNF